MEKWYVGVDGGGTKTEIAVSHADGIPVKTVIYPTCSYRSIPIEQAISRVVNGIRECLDSAGIALTDCVGCCVGMPSYGENPENDQIIVAEMEKALAPMPVFLVNDGEVGWAGSLACEQGIHVVSGTGTIAFGRDKNQTFDRSGGWGYFMGDEGSCYWVGLEAMHLFAKQADGRVPRGALYDIVTQVFALKSAYQLIDIAMADFVTHRDRVADFQRYAMQAALAGDESVCAVYERAADELASLVKALQTRLQFSVQTVPVSYSGGLFHSGELILKPLRERVETLGCVLQTPKRSAIEGALLLAMEKFG